MIFSNTFRNGGVNFTLKFKLNGKMIDVTLAVELLANQLQTQL